MIALTQLLFWFCIVEPVFALYNAQPRLEIYQVLLLVLSTVLIAAGGYVINDFYDLPIDLVNKPEKVIVGEKISDDAAFNYFSALTGLGVVISVIVAFMLGNFRLALLPIFIASLLWFYAQIFKRQFFIGNVIVSFATAAVMLLLIAYEFVWENYADFIPYHEVILFAKIYMAFAFITSLLRELVKDMQDRKGDGEFGASTIPIKLGLQPAKIWAYVYLLLLIVGVGYLQKYLFIAGWKWLAIYGIVLIQIPALIAGWKMWFAQTNKEFGVVSNWVKVVMLFGIVTMIFVGQLMVHLKSIQDAIYSGL